VKRFPHHHNLEHMLEHFRPEWIALREHEYRNFTALDFMKFLETEYRVERIFRADPAQTAGIFRANRNVDTCFYLLRKRS
jgi:hypothetical protein